VSFIELSCVWLKCFIVILRKGTVWASPRIVPVGVVAFYSEVRVFVTLLLLVVGYKFTALK